MHSVKSGQRIWLTLALLTLSTLSWAADLPGTLTWGDRIPLGTLVSGVVKQVGVQPGQRVKKGDVLVALDSRLFDARLAQARAAYAYAKSRLQEARHENQRSQELYDRTLLSDHERNLAVIALKGAESDKAQAHVALVKAQLEKSYSQLRSPVDGLVLAVHARVGQALVNRLSSQTLVELVSVNPMRLQVRADAPTADGIARASQHTVEVAGQRLPVTRLQVGLEPVATSQAGPEYRVTAYFKRPADLALRAGQAATLSWAP